MGTTVWAIVHLLGHIMLGTDEYSTPPRYVNSECLFPVSRDLWVRGSAKQDQQKGDLGMHILACVLLAIGQIKVYIGHISTGKNVLSTFLPSGGS